jgi:hypothetical protein
MNLKKPWLIQSSLEVSRIGKPGCSHSWQALPQDGKVKKVFSGKFLESMERVVAKNKSNFIPHITYLISTMTYTNKTQPTIISPESFLNKSFAKDEIVQKQALALIDVYTKATGSKCVMWNKIFGFGKYYYKDSRGGEHSYLMTGFAISKTGFTLYNMIGWEDYKKEIEALGTYKVSGNSCLAIKSTRDIDIKILKAVIKSSCADMKKKYKFEI